MSIRTRFLNCVVASVCAISLFLTPSFANDGARLDDLHAQLLQADRAEAIRLAREIELEWSKSGSASADLLLKRGTDALEAGNVQAAIEHLTALTDHAPDFAEGWHRRSLAYLQVDLLGPAVADLERALALKPRHYDAIAALGGIFIQINKYDQAKVAFDQVLAIHPHHPEVTEAMEHLGSQLGGMKL